MVTLQKFKTLLDLLIYFKDEQVCREFAFRYNTRDLSECARFDKMLNNIATTLPYKQLTENEIRTEIQFPTDRTNAYRWMEAKQGDFGL